MANYTRKPGRFKVNTSGELPEMPSGEGFVDRNDLNLWWEENRLVLNRQRDEDMVQATPTATSFEAATVWNYEHNLGRFPIIQILDVDGNLISPSIQHISVNHVRITHGSDKSGTLILY